MSMFRKAAVYLGLVDEDEDEVYEYEEEPYEQPERSARPAARPAPAAHEPATPTVSAVRRVEERISEPTTNLRVAAGATASAAVRAVAPAPSVHVLDPKSFNDAQEVGDRLKVGTPVILNLQGIDRDLQRRLIDFSSGLCYALSGTMSKAADQVFLLTPPDVEVSDDEKERLRGRGLYQR
jgi:cell division inhibitor SepF